MEDSGTQQELSHLHFLHFIVPYKGPHIQVLQPIGHLRQMVGDNGGGGKAQFREETSHTLIYLFIPGCFHL